MAEVANSTPVSRRGLLVATSTFAAAVVTPSLVAFDPHAMPLSMSGLVARLEAVHARYDAASDSAESVDMYEQHWLLREQINRRRASTIEECCGKGRAAEIALALDPDAECGDVGSFVKLASSLIKDLQALRA